MHVKREVFSFLYNAFIGCKKTCVCGIIRIVTTKRGLITMDTHQKMYEENVARFLDKIEKADNLQALQEVRIAVLGKNGEWTHVLKTLKDVPAELRSSFGKFINDARAQMETAINLKQTLFEEALLAERLQSEKIDITIDKKSKGVGSLHPINQTRLKIAEFFISMGFMVADGNEIETDYYNFEALNTPDDHPARDMQDTFFFSKHILLRSQTSSAQIRVMEKIQPPIKMISSGRVYRSDDVDATHSPMFHQMEGLVVDKGITLCDLKGILDAFAKKFFGEQTKTRFRPSFFPFTEPSVEVDASCFICGGSGEVAPREDGSTNCRVCKGTGWIEILGAGLVNRRVLANCGIDPDVYSGFAFGMGLDRITNILHAITDLRVVFENDIRFLKQFKGGVSL